MDSTTVQSQFFVEADKFILDVLGTGAVVPCIEIQQDVDLQETDKQNNAVRRGKGLYKKSFRELLK